jgi:hypothetical protein
MARLITPEEFQDMESSFRSVFSQGDPAEPFVAEITGRLLLSPIDYTLLDRIQFEAVAAASLSRGIESAFHAEFGRDDVRWGKTYNHRTVDLQDYADYRGVDDALSVEHFLFSPTGGWGVVTSDGEYAVIGGDTSFVDDVRRRLGYEDEIVLNAFVTKWRELEQAGAVVHWVPKLLDHVLGRGEGRRRWLSATGTA